MCCSFVIPVLCLVLRVFFHIPPIPTAKQDWMMLSLCDSFIVFDVLEYFSTVLPNSTYKAGIEWCAALLWFSLCLVLEYFQQSYPIST
jgi:hypothetical protein